MTQILNTNVASLLVQRNLSQSQEAINISMDRLSSNTGHPRKILDTHQRPTGNRSHRNGEICG